MPVAFLLAPSLSAWLDATETQTHWLLFGLAVPISGIALFRGYRRQANGLTVLLGVLGLALMLLGVAHVFGEDLEIILTTAGVFLRSPAPIGLTDLMRASRRMRRRASADFKPTSSDRIAMASSLRLHQAPPWPKDHNRTANHHLLSRLRRLSRVQSGPAAAVAGASIPADQHRAARPPHRQVASGAAGKASGHRPGQPCQVASMCMSVRWRGTHLHAAPRSLRFRCGGVGSQRPVRH